MHRAHVTIDLPSDDLPSDPVLLGVLKWIFTTQDTGALERLTGNGLAWSRRLMGACARGGLVDLVALVADGTELYLGERGALEQFGEVLEAVLERGGLRGGFEELRIVVAGQRDDWHAVTSIRLRTEVAKGVPEFELEWSARSLGLRVRPEESPQDYQRRIARIAADGVAAAAAMATPDAMFDGVLGELAQDVGANKVTASDRGRVVVVPGPTQVGRFRTLGFGRALRGRVYRPAAVERRTGAYDEPQVYYFFDPYHDLLSWIVAGEVAAQRWQGPEIALVDHHGKPLPVGPGSQAAWAVPPDAVTIGSEAIAVDERVPEVAGLDLAEAGNPNSPGFGGGRGG